MNMVKLKEAAPIILFSVFVAVCIIMVLFIIQWQQDRDYQERYQRCLERVHRVFTEECTFVYIKEKDYLICNCIGLDYSKSLCLFDLSDWSLKDKVSFIEENLRRQGWKYYEYYNIYIPYVIYNYEIYGKTSTKIKELEKMFECHYNLLDSIHKVNLRKKQEMDSIASSLPVKKRWNRRYTWQRR